METISNSIEDGLINGLSYKLDATASYITERKSCSFFAMGGNSYSSTGGTRVIKMVLNGEGWLDPSTVKINIEIANLNGSQPLRTLSGPWAFFRRLRVLCQGQLIEDIDYYNKVHQMFDVLQSEHVRNNEDIEGFGHRYDSKASKALIAAPAVKVGGTITEPTFLNQYVSIGPGDKSSMFYSPERNHLARKDDSIKILPPDF